MKNTLVATFTLSAVLIGAVSSVQAGVIIADAADGMLENRSEWTTGPVVHNADNWEYSIGEWYGTGLATVVIPFELPNLGATIDPFTSADFGVMVNPNSTPVAATDVDLYGVRVDASPSISSTDWYNGAAPDPTATLLQASFLTPASPRGWDGVSNNNTDAAGDAALTSYLNTAYDGGAGAGQFVFLRLSYGSDDYAAGWDTYNLTSRDAGGAGEWPVITYEAIPEPGTLGLVGLASAGILFFRRLHII